MNERPEVHPIDTTNHVSDREAGGLLLAFLTVVLLVLAVATIPLGPAAEERTDGTVTTVPRR
jgi:hypothetical protein